MENNSSKYMDYRALGVRRGDSRLLQVISKGLQSNTSNKHGAVNNVSCRQKLFVNVYLFSLIVKYKFIYKNVT